MNKKNAHLFMLLAVSALMLSAPAFARGSTGSTPTVMPCTVETNHKCVYPTATLKYKHFFKKWDRVLRKLNK